MIDSGFEQVISSDPDRRGCCKIIIAYNPLYPLALGRIECAAGLDLDIRVNLLENKPTMHCIELVLTGKCLDISELAMRLQAWAEQYSGILSMPEEAIYAKQAPFTKSGSSEGTEEPGV